MIIIKIIEIIIIFKKITSKMNSENNHSGNDNSINKNIRWKSKNKLKKVK